MMEMTTAGMGKDVHLGCVDGSQEAFGLIAVRVEMAMDGGEHTVDLEAFTLGHIEGAVDQDLDLEPLEETVVLAALGRSSARLAGVGDGHLPGRAPTRPRDRASGR